MKEECFSFYLSKQGTFSDGLLATSLHGASLMVENEPPCSRLPLTVENIRIGKIFALEFITEVIRMHHERKVKRA